MVSRYFKCLTYYIEHVYIDSVLWWDSASPQQRPFKYVLQRYCSTMFISIIPSIKQSIRRSPCSQKSFISSICSPTSPFSSCISFEWWLDLNRKMYAIKDKQMVRFIKEFTLPTTVSDSIVLWDEPSSAFMVLPKSSTYPPLTMKDLLSMILEMSVHQYLCFCYINSCDYDTFNSIAQFFNRLLVCHNVEYSSTYLIEAIQVCCSSY